MAGNTSDTPPVNLGGIGYPPYVKQFKHFKTMPKGNQAPRSASQTQGLVKLSDFLGESLNSRLHKDKVLDGSKIDMSDLRVENVGMSRLAVVTIDGWEANIAILKDCPQDLTQAELVLREYKQEDANGNPTVKCFFRKKA